MPTSRGRLLPSTDAATKTANRDSSGLSQQHSPWVSDVVTWQCMPYNPSAVSTPSLPSHLHPLPTTAPLRFQPAVRRLSSPACRKDSQSAQSLPKPAQACQGYSGGKSSVSHRQAVLRLAEGRMLTPVFPYGFPGYCCSLPAKVLFLCSPPYPHCLQILDKAEQHIPPLANAFYGETQWPVTDTLNAQRPGTL